MRLQLWWRQARSSPGASMLIALMVVVGALVLTLWPRLLESTFVDDANYQLNETPLTHRALTGSLVSEDFSNAELSDALREISHESGSLIREHLGEPRFSTTTAVPQPFVAPGGRPSDLYLTSVWLRQDPDIAEYVDLTAGDLPRQSDGGEVLQVMLSAESAQRAGLEIGDTWEWAEGAGFAFTVELTGLFEPLDPDDAQWQHQLNVIDPLIQTDPNQGDSAEVIAYLDPHGGELWGNVEIWIPIDPDTDQPEQFRSELRAATSRTYSSPLFPTQQLQLQTPLVPVLDTAIGRWGGTSAFLNTAAAGPAGVLVAVLALTATLAVTRRRDTLALARARGGAPLQVRGALAAEGLVLGVPAAIIGAGLATVLWPTETSVSHYLGAALIALAPAVFLATSRLPNLRTARSDLGLRSRSRLRWITEVLIVALATASLIVAQARGVSATPGSDPLTIVTPLLLAIATAVVAVRILPVPILALHRWLRRRPGLTGFLGSARAVRDPVSALIPVLALLVGVSIAVFSVIMVTTLRTGVQEAARVEAGADLRLSGPTVSDEQYRQLRAIDGVAEVARVTVIPNVLLAGDNRRDSATLIATDTTALPRVQAGVAGAVTLPPDMDTLDDDGRAKVVTSDSFDALTGAPRLALNPSLEVSPAGQADAATALSPARSWVLADLELLREHTGRPLMPRLVLFDLDDGADIDHVIDRVRAITGGTGVISSPALNVETFQESPAAASLESGFGLALGLTVLLSVLAVVLTLVLTAPARGRLIAVLRTLGATPSIGRRLVGWEAMPLVLVATVFGTGLGLALPVLMTRMVDLRAFTGGSTPPGLVFPPLLIGGVVGALAAVLAVGVLLAAWLARRLSLTTLRIGDAP